ncbi:MAG: cell division protein ZapA [Desulfoarculaceae bacterium]|nr:cell division protein ZapA [Desulfoarculaceae bacterium]
MERLVRFELLGQEYSFYTGAPENEVADILDLVKGLVEENLTGASGSIPVGKVAVLVSLNIASRYFELKSNFDTYRADTEQRIAALTSQIDSGLSPKKGEEH